MHGPPASAQALEQEVLRLYDAGRYSDAFSAVEAGGGIDALTGASGRAIAGRLAGALGADRYASAIHLRAWRQTPDANALGFFVGMAVARLWGPVTAIDWLDRMLTQDLTARGVSEVQSARAYQFALLRDYSQADAALSLAYEAEPERPWLRVTQGYLLASQDRPIEAIAAYREALQLKPTYRPAVQSLAGGLVQQNEVEEARDLLIKASSELQSGLVLLQLAQLERELGDYKSAQQRMEAALPLLPLRDKDRNSDSDYNGFAATLAYENGDIDGAIRLGEASDHKFHETVVDNLRKHRDTGRRVVLDVGFTLQHDVTCVPATLSTLTEYWGQHIPHLDIAEAICYDGTPAHAERAWLEERGYFCREFTLTWETAIALIDAGLPFTQTLTGYTMGHMQAVIGYDSRRGVLIYRDPNVRHAGEVLGKELIERQRSTGPRGMVFVPEAERGRVEALDLPDHELWAASHAVSLALAEHRRPNAVEAYQRMRAADPKHRLTRHARARIASYDGDLRTLDKLTDRLLKEFPDDANQWSVKVRLMRQLGSRSERLGLLRELCDRSDVEEVYRHQFIEELLDDPQELPRVDYLLRRCRRSNSLDAQTMNLLARRAWIAKDRERALLWTRYAACVDARAEDRSAMYFAASAAMGRTEESLALLRDRRQRFGDKDAGPAISLIDALDQMLRQDEALEVLGESLAARPDDGDLKLFAAGYYLRVGRREDAETQLRAARGKCHEANWLSTAAQYAKHENRFDDAYRYLERALKRTPLNLNAHRQAVDVLADGRGIEAAVEHLRGYVERFPKNIDLRAMLVEFSAEIGPEEAVTAAREHLALHHEDAWCWRELGFRLVDQRRWDEADQAAGEAERHEPDAMQNRVLRASIAAGRGDQAAARDYYSDALRISVDYSAAFAGLMQLCETRSQRQEALELILSEFKRQVIFGETLHAFRAQAARAFEPQEALEALEQARQARPDLPPTWSVVVEQLIAMDRLPDALGEARGAVARFPLLPSPRVDLAGVYREMGEEDLELEQLRQALAINSRSGEVLRYLAEAFGRRGDHVNEQRMIRRACESEPRNVTHRGALAEFFWRRGDRATAIATIREAIEQEPHYQWGWSQLTEWSFVVGRPKTLIEMTEAITASRPESVKAWLQRAEVLLRFPGEAATCFQAIRRAIAIDARSVDAHEQHAIFLAEQGRFDEAISACDPEVFGGESPLQLRARAAVVESQRGELETAIARMREVLSDDPDYAWAWSQLSSWLQQKGESKDALAAAQNLLVLAPRTAASWGYVAECLASEGEVERAKDHLKRSIELDASYLYGGNALESLQTEAGEYEQALTTLAIIGPHLSDHDRAAREARLRALAGDKEKAFPAMRRAIRHAAETDELLREAADAILLAGWAETLKSLLADETAAKKASPQGASVYVEVLAREGRLSAIEQLCNETNPASAHWAEASAAFLDALGQAGANERLDAFIGSRSEALRKQSRTWGLVGWALQLNGRHREAIAWMSDWPSRSETEPHQLLPLAMSLLCQGDLEQARAAADHGLSLPLAPTSDTLRVLGACAETLDGDALATAQRLEPVAPQSLAPFYQSLHALMRVASHAALGLDQQTPWHEAWSTWRQAFGTHYLSDADSDAFYQAIIHHARLLLYRRHWNSIRTWRAEQKGLRLRATMAE